MKNQSEKCVNGYLEVVNIKVSDIIYLDNDVFKIIIHYCERIIDVEYKNDVVLRSQLKDWNRKGKDYV